MTDDTVPRERSRGNTGWTEAEHRYRSAAEALRSATVDAAGGRDVDDAVARDHQLAGKRLLETRLPTLATSRSKSGQRTTCSN